MLGQLLRLSLESTLNCALPKTLKTGSFTLHSTLRVFNLRQLILTGADVDGVGWVGLWVICWGRFEQMSHQEIFIKLTGKLFLDGAEHKITSILMRNITQSHAEDFFSLGIMLVCKRIEFASNDTDRYWR